MKTKKRVLPLVLVVCLAVSMIVAMSGCSKKSLEEYMNSSTMQKMIETQAAEYESMGATLSARGEGDNFIMDINMTDPQYTASDEIKAALQASLDSYASTFVDQANELKKACSNDIINVVVTYYDPSGTVLATGTYTSTN